MELERRASQVELVLTRQIPNHGIPSWSLTLPYPGGLPLEESEGVQRRVQRAAHLPNGGDREERGLGGWERHGIRTIRVSGVPPPHTSTRSSLSTGPGRKEATRLHLS